jgi:Domain of unknown function (DUF5666)
MYKKITVPLILALVAALMLSSVALAAPETKSTVRRVGTIINIDTAFQTFKLALNNGTKLTIHVNGSTLYRGRASDLAGLSNGMYVNVTTTSLSSGELLAMKVNVLKVIVKAKVTGYVSSVDASAFTVTATNGKIYTFQVTANTTISGKGISSFNGLLDGMKVRVTYSNLGSEGLRATAIVVLKK